MWVNGCVIISNTQTLLSHFLPKHNWWKPAGTILHLNIMWSCSTDTFQAIRTLVLTLLNARVASAEAAETTVTLHSAETHWWPFVDIFFFYTEVGTQKDVCSVLSEHAIICKFLLAFYSLSILNCQLL